MQADAERPRRARVGRRLRRGRPADHQARAGDDALLVAADDALVDRGRRPKSSALTIRTRRSSQAELLGQRQRLAEPVVRVLARRPPVARPAEPLQREVQPRAVDAAASARSSGAGAPSPHPARYARSSAQPLARREAARERGQVDQRPARSPAISQSTGQNARPRRRPRRPSRSTGRARRARGPRQCGERRGHRVVAAASAAASAAARGSSARRQRRSRARRARAGTSPRRGRAGAGSPRAARRAALVRRVHAAEPRRDPLPHGVVADLPQLDARHLLDEQPGRRRLAPRTARPDAGRRQDRAGTSRSRAAAPSRNSGFVARAWPSSRSRSRSLRIRTGSVPSASARGPPRAARSSRTRTARHAGDAPRPRRAPRPAPRRPPPSRHRRSSSDPSTRSESRCSSASSRAARRCRS